MSPSYVVLTSFASHLYIHVCSLSLSLSVQSECQYLREQVGGSPGRRRLHDDDDNGDLAVVTRELIETKAILQKFMSDNQVRLLAGHIHRHNITAHSQHKLTAHSQHAITADHRDGPFLWCSPSHANLIACACHAGDAVICAVICAFF